MKKKRKTGFLIKIFICVFAAYSAVTLVTLQIEINERSREIDELSQTVKSEIIKNSELHDTLDKGLDDENIAAMARDKLGYASPGERVFVDSSNY